MVYAQVIVCSCIEELHGYVNKSELTVDLEGTMPYSHSHWIQQRIVSFTVTFYKVFGGKKVYFESKTLHGTNVH